MNEAWTRISDSECGTLLTGCITGAKHREKDLPCQDASVASVHYYKGHPYALLAVADGHGAARYTRSELGAHFAVQAAAEAAARWVMFATECVKQQPDDWLTNARKDFGTSFARTLRKAWDRKVDEHLDNYPLDDAADGARSGYHAYGTTVALALIFHDQMFVGAIGDSAVVIVGKAENTVDVLVGEGIETLGLSTHSLAQEDAALKWEHRMLPLNEVRMLCAATDGFIDSLKDVSCTLSALHRDTRGNGFGWFG